MSEQLMMRSESLIEEGVQKRGMRHLKKNRAFTIFYFILQFVQFTRGYNITPSVLISANHSTTESGNSAPVHNGITTWIEVSLAH